MITVGEILKKELSIRKISQKNFAEKFNMKNSHFSELLSNKRTLSVRKALELEKLLGILAEFWLNIQNKTKIDYEKENRRLYK